jgi:hypothetical protein
VRARGPRPRPRPAAPSEGRRPPLSPRARAQKGRPRARAGAACPARGPAHQAAAAAARRTCIQRGRACRARASRLLHASGAGRRGCPAPCQDGWAPAHTWRAPPWPLAATPPPPPPSQHAQHTLNTRPRTQLSGRPVPPSYSGRHPAGPNQHRANWRALSPASGARKRPLRLRRCGGRAGAPRLLADAPPRFVQRATGPFQACSPATETSSVRPSCAATCAPATHLRPGPDTSTHSRTCPPAHLPAPPPTPVCPAPSHALHSSRMAGAALMFAPLPCCRRANLPLRSCRRSRWPCAERTHLCC